LRRHKPAGSELASDPESRGERALKSQDEIAARSLHDTQTQINLLRQKLQAIPRIILIRLRSLGDAILTLPLVEALHAWRPELQLDVLVEDPYAPVFSHHPAIHEVLILRARNRLANAGWTRFRAAIEIWKRHYPAALNLHGGTTSMLFTAITGAKLRIGQESHRGSWLYNAQIPPSNKIWQRPSIHTVEHQLSLMRWLGLSLPSQTTGSLFVEEAASKRIQERLAQAGVSDYLLIQPTATQATKQWSSQKFAELGDRLFRQHGVPIIYTAAPHEIAVLQEIQKTAGERHLYWSDLSLDDLFALIGRCRLFIGNDSGPTHAASALKKPLVVVWGSSDFQVWHPWSVEYEAVRSNLPCMPCPGYTCDAFGKPKCILDITVPQVLEACERILARTRQS
jgi:predicted lipopolysaccharide heptosyltransferase III